MAQKRTILHAAHTVGRASAGGSELVNELVALANLLHQGPSEAQAAYRAGVQWHPAGVLMEQLLADLTIVYSLPKVGGTTIAATLNAHPAVRPEAFHLHYLSPKGLSALERQIGACSHPNVSYLQAQLAQGRGARALLAANRALREGGAAPIVRKPFLIAGVRDPITLSLSLAFESWWLLAPQLEGLGLEFLNSWVLKNPLRNPWDDWFTDELEEVFDVDVYARPFPAERGWDVYENDAARVLVIRQENLDRLPDALGALYGLEPATFAVKTCNVAAHKDYADHYRRAKQMLRLNEAELDLVYGTRSVRHFYTQEEIASFRRRWSADRPATENPPLPAAPKPTATVSPEPARAHDATPHVGVCRPCGRCAQQLLSIPGLQKSCADLCRSCVGYAEYVQQLESALRDAQQPPLPPPPGPFRSFARRLPGPIRALARRILGRPR